MPDQPDGEKAKSLYGFLVVIVGFVLVGVAFVLSVYKWTDSKDVTAAVGAVTSIVGTLAGAFFGINVGAAGKERAEAERNAAQKDVVKLAALLPPDQAARAFGIEDR